MSSRIGTSLTGAPVFCGKRPETKAARDGVQTGDEA